MRGWTIISAIIMGLTLAGFLFALRQPPQQLEVRVAAAATGNAPAAPRYSEMPTSPRRYNANFKLDLANLEAADREAPKEPELAQRGGAVDSRAENRWFDGAPPVVPHQILQRDDATCLSCHGKQIKVGTAVARPMSHGHLTMCTQCHVEERAGDLFVPTGFAGRLSPKLGERAFPEAPPTMPHPIFMRRNCNSCHGKNGRIGLRTTHPERQSCLQCHGPSAVLDQRGSL